MPGHSWGGSHFRVKDGSPPLATEHCVAGNYHAIGVGNIEGVMGQGRGKGEVTTQQVGPQSSLLGGITLDDLPHVEVNV